MSSVYASMISKYHMNITRITHVVRRNVNGFRCSRAYHLVDKASIRECSSDHDFVVAAARTVAIKIRERHARSQVNKRCWLKAPLDENNFLEVK